MCSKIIEGLSSPLGPEPTTPVSPQPSPLSSSKRESARVYHNLVSDCQLECFWTLSLVSISKKAKYSYYGGRFKILCNVRSQACTVGCFAFFRDINLPNYHSWICRYTWHLKALTLGPPGKNGQIIEYRESAYILFSCKCLSHFHLQKTIITTNKSTTAWHRAQKWWFLFSL